MIFRQLFDPASSTYTYLLGDRATGAAVVIDPVLEQSARDLALTQSLGLRLEWVVDTHVHADHVTGANALKAATGALTAVGAGCEAVGYDCALRDGDRVEFGAEQLLALATPGHTPGSTSFVWRDRVFTGDTLLIGGCGRADFQGGDARALYASITGRLFALPDDTRVFPGHDYQGRTETSIGRERTANPRLAGKTEAEFVALMAALDLPRPRRIDEALPRNRIGGLVDADDAPWATLAVGDTERALADDRALLIDLRDHDDYAAGHARGAVPARHDDLERLAGLARGCGALYLICRTGRRSLIATRALAARGVANVVNVAGGMRAWQVAGLAVESGGRPPASGAGSAQ
jgi:glyoxylase-like metal-dependent hydrolase (beta-lactamase superfamily II)/rhodanese-related sulfurtransferase